jgi:hypothetical protein
MLARHNRPRGPADLRFLAANGFSRSDFVVALLVLALGIGLVLPAIGRVREADVRNRAAENLRRIGGATLAYSDAHGVIPHNGGRSSGYDPNGWGPGNTAWFTGAIPDQTTAAYLFNLNPADAAPESSTIQAFPEVGKVGAEQPGPWCYAILPQLGHGEIATDPEGYCKPITEYRCPARGRPATIVATSARNNVANPRNPWTHTDYAVNLVLVGNRYGIRWSDAAQAYTRGPARLDRIPDGASATILCGQKSMKVENYASGSWAYDEPIWCGGHNGTGRGYRGWPRHDDRIWGEVVRDVDGSSDERRWGAPFAVGCPFLFADGAVRFVPYGKDIRTLLDPSDGQAIDPCTY